MSTTEDSLICAIEMDTLLLLLLYQSITPIFNDQISTVHNAQYL